MLIPLTVTLAELPARSWAVKPWDCEAPSVSNSKDPEAGDSRPEPESVAEKLAVTLLLFQPLALARGARETVITGSVLSMLMPLTVAGELVLPALSVQEPTTDCPSPSVPRVTGCVQ